MVDTISSLGSIEYRHDEWGVDVTIGGSQKGSDAAARLVVQCHLGQGTGGLRARQVARAFWQWDDMLEMNKTGYFPTRRPPTCFYGLREALAMLNEEGLPNVFARHIRHGEAVRCAVKAWGLELVALNPAEYSPC